MHRRRETGAVTAEAAMVLPVLVLFTVAMAWLVSLGVTQVRAVDGARETARAVARGDDQGEALRLGRRVAGTGARVSVSRRGDLVTVRVATSVRGPVGLFARVSPFVIRAEAVALAEDGT